MTREQLKQYLLDQPLMQAVTARCDARTTYKKLMDAIDIMRETNVSTIAEVEQMAERYREIANEYEDMIERIWKLRWQDIYIICKYIDYTDLEIDRLPNRLEL